MTTTYQLQAMQAALDTAELAAFEAEQLVDTVDEASDRITDMITPSDGFRRAGPEARAFEQAARHFVAVCAQLGDAYDAMQDAGEILQDALYEAGGGPDQEETA